VSSIRGVASTDAALQRKDSPPALNVKNIPAKGTPEGVGGQTNGAELPKRA